MRIPSASARIQIGMIWPPHKAKIRSTPWERKNRAMTAAVDLSVTCMPLPLFRRGFARRLLRAPEIDDVWVLARVEPSGEDLELVHPLRGRDRQVRPEQPPGRHFEIGQPFVAPVEQLPRQFNVGGCSSSGDDAGHHLLFPQFVRYGERSRLSHLRVHSQAFLDFRRRDVLAGAADDVLLPVEEVKHTGLVAGHLVAGMEPATAPGVFSRLFVFEIARKETLARRSRGMPHHQLSGLAVRDVPIVLIDCTGIKPGRGAPARAGMNQTWVNVVGDESAGLAHGPEFDERKAKPLFALGVLGGIDTSAEAEAHLVLALQLRWWKFQEHVGNHALVMNGSDAAIDEVLPPGAAVKPVREEQRAAGDKHARHGNAQAVGVMQRERIVHTLLSFAQMDYAGARRIPRAPGMKIFIGEDAALGPPGRARGVE